LCVCGGFSNQSSTLKQVLAAVDGHFDWSYKSNTHDYSKWQELIDVVLAQSPGAQKSNLPESVLAELVDCFYDSSPSNSVFRDKPIPPG
jgi:hypothetical protein